LGQAKLKFLLISRSGVAAASPSFDRDLLCAFCDLKRLKKQTYFFRQQEELREEQRVEHWLKQQ